MSKEINFNFNSFILKYFALILQFVFIFVSAQKEISFGSNTNENNEIFLDDYGNVYFYDNQNFTFSKTDSLGNEKGKYRWASPFTVLGVQNPLNLVIFSQNSQEIRILDENLNQIQSIKLGEIFGFIENIFVEDLQFVWLFNSVNQEVILYNYRKNEKIRTFSEIFTEKLIKFMVYENKIYYLTENRLIIHELNPQARKEIRVENPQRIFRENDRIFISTKDTIFQLIENKYLAEIFNEPKATAVGKNSSEIFFVIDNVLFFFK